MKKLNYKEFVGRIEKMNVGDTFDFYENYGEESGETFNAYGVKCIAMFDAIMVIINYYGGGMPFIIDVTMSDYEINSVELFNYFYMCSDIIYNDLGYREYFVFVEE